MVVGCRMKAFAVLLRWVVLFVFVSSVTAGIEPIEIKGSHFFFKNNGTALFVSSLTCIQDETYAGSFVGLTMNHMDTLRRARAPGIRSGIRRSADATFPICLP